MEKLLHGRSARAIKRRFKETSEIREQWSKTRPAGDAGYKLSKRFIQKQEAWAKKVKAKKLNGPKSPDAPKPQTPKTKKKVSMLILPYN